MVGLTSDVTSSSGAHYTHDAAMQKIVQPTIVRPWTERVENLSSPRQAAQAQAELMRYVVLDPACGSGNFLYLAYRELRRIERRLQEREAERRAAGMPDPPRLNVFFPLQNIRGIELDPFAVALARVTLWMGHRLAVEELALDERTLPLADLSGIVNDDALRMPWPRADAIIGNPLYHGSQNPRQVLGDERVKWLASQFDTGVQDLCVYWFRRAAEEMRPGARAGLVGTNSISQNRARGVSLNYVVERGGVITDAVSRQKWPGEAVVNVSIVNWVKGAGGRGGALRARRRRGGRHQHAMRESKLAVEEYDVLPANLERSFQGSIPACIRHRLTPSHRPSGSTCATPRRAASRPSVADADHRRARRHRSARGAAHRRSPGDHDARGDRPDDPVQRDR